MKQRRIEAFLMLAVLLIVNFGTLLWLQGKPFAAAWANGLAATEGVAPATVAVTIPRTFSYQGTLRDVNGNLINGTVNLTLNIYNAVTGGVALHTETFTGVTVRAGVFSVVVGDAKPIVATVFDTAPLYIGLQVNQDPEMLPRQRLHPVPFAMQAITAQTAGAATNLTQGGGVPGLVTFGAGGAKQISFPDGGKLTDSATGMTINGGGNMAVTMSGALNVGGAATVNGDLNVKGNWNTAAILSTGDSATGQVTNSSYPVSLKRYVVTASDKGTAPTSIPLDNTILTSLCQDEDGCSVSLYMRDWDPARKPGVLTGVGPYRFSLSVPVNGQRDWVMVNPLAGATSGADGNGVTEHAIDIYHACYFTDGSFSNGRDQGDTSTGFALLNWSGTFDDPKMTCELIIED